MITESKKIFMKSYKERQQNRSNTNSIMKNMMNYRKKKIRESREESFSNYIDEISKQETFDRSQLGVSQKENSNQRLNKTPKRMTLQEQRDREFWNELDDILRELDSV